MAARRAARAATAPRSARHPALTFRAGGKAGTGRLRSRSAALEHKSELGGVVLNVRTPAEAAAAARQLSSLSPSLLIEEMVGDGVAEVLIGLRVDPQFGLVLVLGAGG